MKLPREDVKLFYKLHWPLLFYANQKYQILKGLKSPDFKDKNPLKISELQKKLHSDNKMIDSFISENPFKFNMEELELVKKWKNSVIDRFLILSHSKDYTVFLKHEKESKAFGVSGFI